MSTVDHLGFVLEPPSNLSTPIGGHAYRIIWWDGKKKGFLMRNSWGTAFGIRRQGVGTGYAYLSAPLVARLLRADGEIAGPTQIALTAVLP
jgi:hypothetical protein